MYWFWFRFRFPGSGSWILMDYFRKNKSYLSGHMSSNHVDFILQYIIVELFSEPEPEPEPDPDPFFYILHCM